MKIHSLGWISLTLLLVAARGAAGAEPTPGKNLLGSWAFSLPDGNPAWLQITNEGRRFSANLLWSVGSARPVSDFAIVDDGFQFRRKIRWLPYGDRTAPREIRGPFHGRLVENELELSFSQSAPASDALEKLVLKGKRMPPLPPRPDLQKVTFGPPIQLFNGRDLSGWKLSNPKKTNGWRAEGGVLINETPKTDFGAYGDFGNLRTDQEFSDFQLSIEYNAPPKGNSGVYLRGMYEAQVVDRDSSMQGIAGPGAIFGRIAPSHNAGRKGGEWNQYVLTLVDRHITVVLNGATVIDNQPIAGCTGGGLSADDTQPGPIFLQGDHTSVQYRRIVLRPVQPK